MITMKDINKQAKKVKTFLSKGLKYFRINDDQNRLSLTNITMLIILFKLCTTPSSSFQDITALSIAALSYQFKRKIEKD